jgi:hypothetical protein
VSRSRAQLLEGRRGGPGDRCDHPWSGRDGVGSQAAPSRHRVLEPLDAGLLPHLRPARAPDQAGPGPGQSGLPLVARDRGSWPAGMAPRGLGDPWDAGTATASMADRPTAGRSGSRRCRQRSAGNGDRRREGGAEGALAGADRPVVSQGQAGPGCTAEGDRGGAEGAGRPDGRGAEPTDRSDRSCRCLAGSSWCPTLRPRQRDADRRCGPGPPPAVALPASSRRELDRLRVGRGSTERRHAGSVPTRLDRLVAASLVSFRHAAARPAPYDWAWESIRKE